GLRPQAAHADDRITSTHYDVLGRATESTDANQVTAYASFDAFGHVAKSWRGVTGLDGITRTLFELNRYDALGQLVETRTPAPEAIGAGTVPPGQVSTFQEFNAFGEITRKGVQGELQEYFEYDAAGRLWRTNEDTGVDRIRLYDLQGNMTAEIRSSGSGRDDIDVKGFLNAQAADDNPYTARLDLNYDGLGHVTARTEAARLDRQGGALVLHQFTSASVTRSASQMSMGEPETLVWIGANEVSLGWNSLTTLGHGDVRVTINYRSALVAHGGEPDESGYAPVTYTGGVAREYRSGVLDGQAGASGTTLKWTDPAGMQDAGISEVTRLRVEKKDVNGEWVTVIDQAPGYGGNEIEVATPPDPSSTLKLELRRVGDSSWFGVEVRNFGDRYRFDARGLALGGYEYQVKVSTPGLGESTVASGTVAITRPPLNTITTPIEASATLMRWQKPAGDIVQSLRYRPAGSGGGWSSLEIRNYSMNTVSGVQTDGLGGGDYEFELLWTIAGQGAPSAHATGTFTVVPSQPASWVPPVNLPPITGLRIVTMGIQGKYAIEWDGTDANSALYTWNGTWYPLAIDSTAPFEGEATPQANEQRVYLAGLPANNYALRIQAGAPNATRQATAAFWIYPLSPGHYETVQVNVPTLTPVVAYYAPVYETRYGTRQVSYQEWVVDSSVVVGWDENGHPIYRQTGHYETRYTTETYSYQVQVGQTPVYARDENGNIVYKTTWTVETQQQWVEGTIPPPTLQVTTPPYTPGHWVAGVDQQLGVNVTTAPGSGAISTDAGAQIGQSAAQDGRAEWLRPTVYQQSDRWGNVLQASDLRSAAWITTYRYNAANQMVQQVEVNAGAGNPLTTIGYDALGRQVAVRDARGYINGQVYDAAGNLLQERHADGGVVSHAYDAFGAKLRTTDAMGNAVGFSYDHLGHLLALDRGVAKVYRTEGNSAVALVSDGPVVERWRYDELGRRLTYTNGNAEVLRWRYDLRGNLVETQQPLGQMTRAGYDAQGRKIVEVDANGIASTWTYDYFGGLRAHTDLGGESYTYTYDHARQLIAQSSGHGQRLSYAYDAAGQLVEIRDGVINQVTSYAYDLAGHRVRERVQQNGVIYQDNHLAYDAAGRLRDVADARVHLSMRYDAVGNRTYVGTRVDYQGVSGETSPATDRYFAYDAMNRQVVVDAVDAAGQLGHQGHRIAYDKNGNRTSDQFWGAKVTTNAGQVRVGYDENNVAIYSYTTAPTFSRSEGDVTEIYRYDRLNRLLDVQRDGTQIDLRLYDGADRVLRSGPVNLNPGYTEALNEGLPAGATNGKEIRINRYDANGRLLHQTTQKSDGSAQADISWDPDELMGGEAFRAPGYDAAGNAIGYTMRDAAGGALTRYSTTLTRFEGYQASVTEGTSSTASPGAITQGYDANGFLVTITDQSESSRNRRFVNDASGRALYVEQMGNVQRQLIVNGEVLGIYGVGIDPTRPTGGNPNFADLADFNFGYAPVSASYPNASPGAYQVRSGDTLQTIAQAAYGDSALWYRIAEANGLASSTDLKVGQTLNIPNRVGTVHNDASTFKPYDPSRITGDVTPNLPMPKDGCGGVGQLLMVIVAVIVTIYSVGTMTAQVVEAELALAGATEVLTFTAPTLMEMGAAALAAGTASIPVAMIGAAAGSVAGQTVGLLTGAIQRFSWKDVALSAVSAGVSTGLGPQVFGGGLGGAVARAAAGNALTQGISVAVGLQKKFDWKAVAASAAATVGGGIVGDGLDLPSSGLRPEGMSPEEFFGKSLVK
ncbi:MAG TPA: LysM peptidoglycan-binding domain-containing protein, partial [Ramlibacter sp.]|nr:LysM peptidoglycan-binding domain-containing protein [Ramlibacter sp.]